jgi:hypothetical protein
MGFKPVEGGSSHACSRAKAMALAAPLSPRGIPASCASSFSMPGASCTAVGASGFCLSSHSCSQSQSKEMQDADRPNTTPAGQLPAVACSNKA